MQMKVDGRPRAPAPVVTRTRALRAAWHVSVRRPPSRAVFSGRLPTAHGPRRPHGPLSAPTASFTPALAPIRVQVLMTVTGDKDSEVALQQQREAANQFRRQLASETVFNATDENLIVVTFTATDYSTDTTETGDLTPEAKVHH